MEGQSFAPRPVPAEQAPTSRVVTPGAENLRRFIHANGGFRMQLPRDNDIGVVQFCSIYDRISPFAHEFRIDVRGINSDGMDMLEVNITPTNRISDS